MTTTEPMAKCHAPNCGAVFPCPATGVCPECDETYVKRIDPIDEAIRDALAHAENLLAVNESERKRIQALITRLVFALGDVS